MSSKVSREAQQATTNDPEVQRQRAMAMADLSNDSREYVYNVNTDGRGRPKVIDWASEARSKAAADSHRQQARQTGDFIVKEWNDESNFDPSDYINTQLPDHMGGQGHRAALTQRLHEKSGNAISRAAKNACGADVRGRQPGMRAREPVAGRPRAASPRSMGTTRWVNGQHVERPGLATNVPRYTFGQAGAILRGNPGTASPAVRNNAPANTPHPVALHKIPARATLPASRNEQSTVTPNHHAATLSKTPRHLSPSPVRALSGASTTLERPTSHFQDIIDKMIKAAQEGKVTEWLIPDHPIMGTNPVWETLRIRIRSIEFALCTPGVTGPWPLETVPMGIIVSATRKFLVVEALQLAVRHPRGSEAAQGFCLVFDPYTKGTMGCTRLLGKTYKALDDAEDYCAGVQAAYDAENMWVDVLKMAREMALSDPALVAKRPKHTVDQKPSPVALTSTSALNHPAHSQAVQSSLISPSPGQNEFQQAPSVQQSLGQNQILAPETWAQAAAAAASSASEAPQEPSAIASAILPSAPTSGQLSIGMYLADGFQFYGNDQAHTESSQTLPYAFNVELRITQLHDDQDLLEVFTRPEALINAFRTMAAGLAANDEPDNSNVQETADDTAAAAAGNGDTLPVPTSGRVYLPDFGYETDESL